MVVLGSGQPDFVHRTVIATFHWVHEGCSRAFLLDIFLFVALHRSGPPVVETDIPLSCILIKDKCNKTWRYHNMDGISPE